MRIFDIFKTRQTVKAPTEEQIRESKIRTFLDAKLSVLKNEFDTRLSALRKGLTPTRSYTPMSAIDLMSDANSLFRTVDEAKKAAKYLKDRFSTGTRTTATKPMPAADLNLISRIEGLVEQKPEPARGATPTIFAEPVSHEKVLNFMSRYNFTSYNEAQKALMENAKHLNTRSGA
ncbi:MAG: hypothetical protein H7A40_00240 [Chlamydiales bacterium]|nr:hypothetical protein [Chlamydiales bacterium]